jgi:hypothetical protein
MMSRRAVTATICSLVSSPTILGASSLMRVCAPCLADVAPGSVTFTLLGWDGGRLPTLADADEQVVIHLSGLWRSGWL